SDPESEHSEQSTDDISKQDEGNDSDMDVGKYKSKDQSSATKKSKYC
ncbi:hypothetical protein Tco_0721477, partial [Tanacetum coccineum]